MNTAVARRIDGSSIALAVVGGVIAIIGALMFLVCLLAPEPRQTTKAMWVVNDAEVVSRATKFLSAENSRFAAVAPITVSMSEFQRLASGQKYLVTFHESWLKGEPTGSRNDEWNIIYVMKDASTDMLIVATENIPWSNPPGWFTSTVFNSKERTFTDVNAGPSHILSGFATAVCLLGILMIFLGWRFRHG